MDDGSVVIGRVELDKNNFLTIPQEFRDETAERLLEHLYDEGFESDLSIEEPTEEEEVKEEPKEEPKPRTILDDLRDRYPEGTRVELVKMNDEQAPPIGTKGTVKHVDDIGTIHVAWDNGSSLGVALGEDYCRPLVMLSDKIKEQILAIRDTGKTNMFDTNTVQYMAHALGYVELVLFIEDNKGDYCKFIMYGKV